MEHGQPMNQPAKVQQFVKLSIVYLRSYFQIQFRDEVHKCLTRFCMRMCLYDITVV